MSEVYKPKGVVIDEIKLINFDGAQSIDIENMFVDLNIYEDMYHSQITGDITIEDTLELIETFPIIGEESLTIRWHVPTASINDYINSGTLRVYRIGNRSASGAKGGKGMTYTLYFIAEEGITNLNNTISRSFNTKTASEIASIVFNDYVDTDKEIDIEPSEGKLKLIVPNWKPFRTMNWLAGNKAVNAKKNADFFFFESLNGPTGPKFNFKSLSTLFEQDSVFDIEFQTQNLSTGKEKNMITASHNIESFSFPKNADMIDNMSNGMYAQTWIFHDPLRKKFVISKENHAEDFHSTEDGNLMYSKNLSDVMNPMQCIRMPGGVNSFPSNISPTKSLNNDKTKSLEARVGRNSIPYITERESSDELSCTSLVGDISAKRMFRTQQLNNYRVIFPDIPGTHIIKLGSIVTFNKPHISHDNDEYNKKMGRFDDRFVSGKYLVMRMRHNISINSGDSEHRYTVTLEGAKDSFVEQVSYKKI